MVTLWSCYLDIIGLLIQWACLALCIIIEKACGECYVIHVGDAVGSGRYEYDEMHVYYLIIINKCVKYD